MGIDNNTFRGTVIGDPRKTMLFVTIFLLVLCTPGWAGTVYVQSLNFSGAYLSWYDPGFGSVATMYDNFQLSSANIVTQVNWVGRYNSWLPITITAWTISFYADNAGQPGSVLSTTRIIGNGGETQLGIYGLPYWGYSAGVNFVASAGTPYWLSVVPDVADGSWFWYGGLGGDSISYQDVYGTRYQKGADMNFTLNGSAVPEPSLALLLGIGFGAVSLIAWRTKK